MRTSMLRLVPLLTAGLVLAGGSAALPVASAATPSAPPAGQLSVICPDLGQVLVAAPPVVGDQAAVPDRGLVRVHVRYSAVDARTARPVAAGDAPVAGAVDCGTVPLNGPADAVARGPLPLGVQPTDHLVGRYSVSVGVTAQPQALSRPFAATAVTPFPADGPLRAYLAGRPGRQQVAMFDSTTGATYGFSSSSSPYWTASIVKVAILGTLLRQTAVAGRFLTGTEDALAHRMIQNSDNSAATALWNEIGQGPGLQGFLDPAGMTSTRPGDDGYWGLTTTTALDQVLLMRTVSYPNAVLTDGARNYVMALMTSVESDQRWGVSAGATPGSTVAIKNGWLPHLGPWEINSIGRIYGLGRDFVLAELTYGSPTMSTGVATVEGAARIVCTFPSPWQRLPGSARDIGAGGSGATWVIGQTPTIGGYSIHRWTGTGWQLVSGGAVAVDVDASGTPWLVNDVGAIYRRNGSVWQRLPGAARAIGVGSAADAWMLGRTPVPGGFAISHWTGTGGQLVSGGAVAVDVDASGTPWLVNDAGAIYRRNGWAWQRLPGGAHAIGAGLAGTAWIVGRTATIGGYGLYRWAGTGWQAVPGGATLLDVDPAGMPWLVNNIGAIYRWRP